MQDSDWPPPARDAEGIDLLESLGESLGLRAGTAGSVQDELTEALDEALRDGDLARVRRIFAHGVDMNGRLYNYGIWCSGHALVTPPMAAAHADRLDIVRHLPSVWAEPAVAAAREEASRGRKHEAKGAKT